MSTFGVLAGSLALEEKPFHKQALDVIQRVFAKANGYVAYKLTRLGRVSDDDVPSFLVITREHGILLIDVVEDHIVDATEANGSEFWKTENGEQSTARNLILELYADEVVSRLKNDLRLYDKRKRAVRIPMASAVFLCRNSQQEID